MNKLLFGILFFIISYFTIGYAQEEGENSKQFPVLKGKYAGQKPPGMKAEIFAPGIVTSNLHDDGSPVFTPDGKEIYWRVWGLPRSIIVFIKEENGIWSRPKVVPFSGKYMEGRICISPDGKRLYFSSNRPLQGSGEPKKDFDFWYVEREGEGWSEPINLGVPVNSEYDEVDMSISQNGTIYFHRERSPENEFDILYSRFENGIYTEPENLGKPVNTENIEAAPYIAPDESFLIYGSDGLPDLMGQGDLYVSYRKKDASWTEPKNLGESVNSKYDEKFTSMTPDGKYLFFVSTRPRQLEASYSRTPVSYEEVKSITEFYLSPKLKPFFCDIYWIDSKILNYIKK